MSITFGQGQNIWTLEDGEYHLERGQPGCKLETTTQAIYVDPKRSALLVIDMQNFFLSEKLGRGPKGRELYEPIKKSIQAMRPHGATVIWLNWGISEDQHEMPPCVLRSFSRDVSPSTIYKGFGSQLPDHLGPLLTKGSWSAEVAQGLADAVDPSDIMIDKVRISGFWSTRLETVLRARGINTLFLSGVNTDQCVMSTFMDAHCLGFDTILLSDCTATTSAAGAYQACISNAESSMGFVMTSEQVSAGFCQ